MNYAVGYRRSMLEFHNHKMNYVPSIIYIHLYILLPFIYFLLISFKMGNVIKGAWIYKTPFALIKQTMTRYLSVTAFVIKFWFCKSIHY